MALAKIIKGDEVIVTAGKDKGKRGTVLKVLSGNEREDTKLLVQGINTRVHFERRNPQENEQGGLKRREAPINISSVQVFNADANRGERVGIRVKEDGSRCRYFKQSNTDIITQEQG